MTRADRLLRTPATFRRLTGITPTAFRRLVGEVAAADSAARVERAARPGRRRKAGGGRTPTLPSADRLLTLLAYYRTSVPHTVLGFLFGPDDSNVSRCHRRPEPLLAGIFRIPERTVERTPEEIRELFVDRTERPTDRPVRGRRRFHSGKRKRHALKTRVVVVRARKRPGRGPRRRRVRVAAISPTSPGSVRDKKVLSRAGVRCPPGAARPGDTAYLGTGLTTPRREPRKGSLTPRQKAGDRRVGRKRVVVGHGVGTMEAWRAAAERWRNPRRRHTLAMKNVAGLRNRMFAG